MSSTTTVETLAVPGAGGGGGSFPGYRNATISNTSTPVPPLVCAIYFLLFKYLIGFYT